MKRGDIVTVAAPGNYGKPRPALVIQSDFFDEHPSVTLCLITSDLRDAPLFRLLVQPTAANGLQKTSQIMVDKILTIPREKVRMIIGTLDARALLEVNRALSLWIGLA
ncbi:MAG: type II toxin-antitoxin system PemK/MazF family toxin [Peptococcaceae bacterium]|jgi:mRNA interferase MazF|nr:type II toxin-antitoxin system PemK/MazF family toxin [Peptococcaceae bacterium]